jgi:putative hemolysin
MFHRTIVRISAFVFTLAACSSGVETTGEGAGDKNSTSGQGNTNETNLGGTTANNGSGSTARIGESASPNGNAPGGGGLAGMGSPAAGYCLGLGYTLSREGYCVFPDGTQCPDWHFFRGQCGQKYSYCNTHGGSVSYREVTKGQMQLAFAVCTLPNGKECLDSTFAETGRCESVSF